MTSTRRSFLTGALGLGVVSSVHSMLQSVARAADVPPSMGVSPEFPTQDPNVVREVVGASHRNLDRVRELVTARPALAKAVWDWGFGDWESALGAASHVGRPDIAGFLLENGATPTIFSAAMLGQVEVVRAFVAASPGVQRLLGPHGISLMRHAQAGGDEAQAVVTYLEELGDADPAAAILELTPDQLERYVGTYTFGESEADRLAVSIDDKGRLCLARGDRPARFLFGVEEDAFFPSGSQAVRIRFDMKEGRAASLSVHDPGVVLTARRV